MSPGLPRPTCLTRQITTEQTKRGIKKIPTSGVRTGASVWVYGCERALSRIDHINIVSCVRDLFSNLAVWIWEEIMCEIPPCGMRSNYIIGYGCTVAILCLFSCSCLCLWVIPWGHQVAAQRRISNKVFQTVTSFGMDFGQKSFNLKSGLSGFCFIEVI